MQDLLKYRDEIAAELSRQLSRVLGKFRSVNTFSGQLEERLNDYALRGKLIRGSLVPFCYDLLEGDGIDRRALSSVGASLELLQSMLLIHDDIMDQDDIRRGRPAIHSQYQSDGRELALSDPGHYGISQGICVGDVSAFTAFGLLSAIELEPLLKADLLRFVSDEMILVGIAQMQDVHHGVLPPSRVDYEAVETMYRYKTGRYTFSLPLSLGALLAGRDRNFREGLEGIGELLGIIFQIVDDGIGLFSDEQTSGKPSGSDLREGKKTVYMQLLLQSLQGDEQQRLESLLGNISEDSEVEWIMGRLRRSGIPARVEARLGELADQCRLAISGIAGREPGLARGLGVLLDYNLSRKF